MFLRFICTSIPFVKWNYSGLHKDTLACAEFLVHTIIIQFGSYFLGSNENKAAWETTSSHKHFLHDGLSCCIFPIPSSSLLSMDENLRLLLLNWVELNFPHAKGKWNHSFSDLLDKVGFFWPYFFMCWSFRRKEWICWTGKPFVKGEH